LASITIDFDYASAIALSSLIELSGISAADNSSKIDDSRRPIGSAAQPKSSAAHSSNYFQRVDHAPWRGLIYAAICATPRADDGRNDT
jgi:hypothetical protein